MKYFIIFIASVILTVAITLPGESKENTNINGPVDMYEKKNKTNVIEVNTKNGWINLNDFFRVEENDRIWGTVGNKQIMVYKHMDKYIYIDGYFNQTGAKWSGDNFRIKEDEWIALMDLDKIKEGHYGTATQKQARICSKLPTGEEIIEMMDNVNLPIFGAHITEEYGQLPGAERSYRNGYHEGFDWYSGATGVEIDKNTKVYPMYAGEIVRIDKNYTELDVEERNQILSDEATTTNKKYQLNLDKLRGRQVWIQSDNGVLVRYAHLETVNKKWSVGDRVDTSEFIGTTGNSGTSNGVLGTEGDIHLHTDILVCGKNFWEFGNVDEMNKKIMKLIEKDEK